MCRRCRVVAIVVDRPQCSDWIARNARDSPSDPYYRVPVTSSTQRSIFEQTRYRMLELGHSIFGLVPAWLGGHAHRLPARLRSGITGPFNGQRRRVDAVAAMFGAIPFATIIETGTYRALTTMFLREISAAPIASIELNRGYFDYSRRRLRSLERVSLFLGHSPVVLEQLRVEPGWRAEPCFFYLDAHWLDDLPLIDELRVIRRGWREFAVLIDDFRVDGDAGYFYDDYGPGKALALPLLAGLTELADLEVFWPAAPSRSETGARRGSIVLASPGPVAQALGSIPALRAAGTLRRLTETASG